MTPKSSQPRPVPRPREAGLAPLRRGEGLAAWRQIVDEIEREIGEGVLGPGEKLPTEAQLSERFGVNRHTVRRALAVLATRGLVRATQGRGTFVEARPLAYPIGLKTRFSEAVSAAGREASGDLIASSEIAADERLAAALGIAPGAPVLELVTVHRADGTPISMARTCLPLPRFEGFDDSFRKTGSLTRAYRLHRVPDYSRLSTRMTGRTASVEEAALLELTPGRVLLVIDSINVDPQGRRIQATRSHFAADRVEFVVET
jgi:GntR family transcriptional regulator, phosphonate transport system regulatory protein